MPRKFPMPRFAVQVDLELYASLKLLAFAREETLGQAIGRTIRHALDGLAARYAACGDLPPECAGKPFDRWPLPVRIAAFVPPSLRDRVGPLGQVSTLSTFGRADKKLKMVNAVLSDVERHSLQLAAFGALSSGSRWGEDSLRLELQAISGGRDLWKLPARQQIEIVLAGEPWTWDSALWTMQNEGRSTKSLYQVRAQLDESELLIGSESAASESATPPTQPSADDPLDED